MDERETYLNLAQTLVAIVLDQLGVNKNIEGSLHRYETDPPDQDQGFALETLQDKGYYVITANDVAETEARYLYQLTYEEESVLHPDRSDGQGKLAAGELALVGEAVGKPKLTIVG